MKLRLETHFIVLLCITILLMPFSSVNAAPPLPSSFYGTAKINGENVREGTIIRALINGRVVAVSYAMLVQGESVYAIDVPGDDPATPEIEGGIEGDTIRFMLGGFLVWETGTWRSGTDTELNLSLTANATMPPPQPTETPPPTPTGLPTQTAISQPTQSPTTGPTPSLTPTRTNTPTTDETPFETADTSAEVVEIQTPEPTETITDQLVSSNEPETQPEISEESRGMGFVLPLIILSGFGVIGAVVFWVIKKNRKEDSGMLL
jgi:hypothetical protein